MASTIKAAISGAAKDFEVALHTLEHEERTHKRAVITDILQPQVKRRLITDAGVLRELSRPSNTGKD